MNQPQNEYSPIKLTSTASSAPASSVFLVLIPSTSLFEESGTFSENGDCTLEKYSLNFSTPGMYVPG